MASRPFETFAEIICKKDLFQKKAIQEYLDGKDPVFWQRADRFAEGLLTVLKEQNIALEYVADAYLRLCKDTLTEQIYFKRTGKYRMESAAKAYEAVYSVQEAMAPYMYGLALSQFLWRNHYEILDFFHKASTPLSHVESYFEIGPGHGIYLAEAMGIFPDASFTAVDISTVSLAITQNMVCQFANASCEYVNKDVHDFEGEQFDYVVMGEVLEHVDDPAALLMKVRSLVADTGHLFITTCANAPAIDHVYLYDSVGAIRSQIDECGFDIASELALASEDIPEEEWEAKKALVNYAALLRKKR